MGGPGLPSSGSSVSLPPGPSGMMETVRCGLLAALLALGVVCGAQPVKFKDCGSKTGQINTVDITSCPSLPCVLHRGQTYGVNVTFTSSTSSQTSKAVVHGILSGIAIPFSIPNADGCKSGIQCPIQNNQKYNYINSLPIKREYPSVKLVVQWELKDDNSDDIFCWVIPVEISG
uniref:NPC intracellular cholesterol transporter 2-like n=1 Tax=Pristiophorus japonicus TaxID=55135 RepID=UPI00398F2C48